jgi:L-lactate dehydrogenase (cytochrome)
LQVIFQYAGDDATKAFKEIHTLSILYENLSPGKCKGNLDPSTVDDLWMNPQRSGTNAAAVTKDRKKPPLHSLLNIDDYAKVAQRTATKKAWAFYSSAADDLITRDANSTMYN